MSLRKALVRFQSFKHIGLRQGADGIVRVWMVSDESAEVTLARADCLKRHTKEVKDLAFHPLNEDLLLQVSPIAVPRLNLASMELIQMLPSDTARGDDMIMPVSSDGHSLLALQNPRRRGASCRLSAATRRGSVCNKETIDAKGTFMVQSATKVADVPSTGFDASADGRAAISDCAGGITVLDQSRVQFCWQVSGVCPTLLA